MSKGKGFVPQERRTARIKTLRDDHSSGKPRCNNMKGSKGKIKRGYRRIIGKKREKTSRASAVPRLLALCEAKRGRRLESGKKGKEGKRRGNFFLNESSKKESFSPEGARKEGEARKETGTGKRRGELLIFKEDRRRAALLHLGLEQCLEARKLW